MNYCSTIGSNRVSWHGYAAVNCFSFLQKKHHTVPRDSRPDVIWENYSWENYSWEVWLVRLQLLYCTIHSLPTLSLFPFLLSSSLSLLTLILPVFPRTHSQSLPLYSSPPPLEYICTTHHSREDESHALDSCLGLVSSATGAVVEREQTLTDWVRVRDRGIIQKSDVPHAPSLRSSGE